MNHIIIKLAIVCLRIDDEIKKLSFVLEVYHIQLKLHFVKFCSFLVRIQSTIHFCLTFIISACST